MKLGDRIKSYERSAKRYLTPNVPVMIRVDGKAFHSFTKNFEYPFDETLMKAMDMSALMVLLNIQSCKAAYVQSDEATFLLTDYDTHDTQGWFDYNHSKMISISAAYMTAYFNEEIRIHKDDIPLAVFDSRAFSVPREDVCNAFLWRARDWKRNSLQMFARKFFSHKELNGKNTDNIHDMLHGIGENWASLPDRVKNGCFIIDSGEFREFRTDVQPTYEDISNIIRV